MRPRDAFPRARAAADRALAMDPTDAFALVMRAHSALWYEWDFTRAESLARSALELAPGFYLAHDCLGLVLAAQGQFEEAIAAMQRARTLDPLSENATYDLAWILMLAGRWDEAIRELPAGDRASIRERANCAESMPSACSTAGQRRGRRARSFVAFSSSRLATGGAA